MTLIEKTHSHLMAIQKTSPDLHFEKESNQILDFGDPLSETLAAKDAVALFDLSSRGKIRVRGEDAASFLHAMTTQHIKNILPNHGAYATVVKATGQLLADLYILRDHNSFLIDCEPSLPPIILETLEHHLIMEDVQLHEETSDRFWIYICGPKAFELVQSFMSLSDVDPECKYQILTSDDSAVLCCRLPYLPLEGLIVSGPENRFEELWAALHNNCLSLGGRPAGLSALRDLQIEAEIPIYGRDMDHNNLMPETGLFDAVHYEKGCYLGQEVIARLDSIAKVKKKLRPFKLSRIPNQSAPLKLYKNNEECGYLTSWTTLQNKNVSALGYLKTSQEHHTFFTTSDEDCEARRP